MPSIIVLTGSPSTTSRTAALSQYVAERLAADGHDVGVVRVRDLPAEALIGADFRHPAIVDVVASVAAADGVVVTSPVYKAAYSGVIKTLLDLLPPSALAGKTALPILTGGSPAHTLAVDYALRPVLSAVGADHIVPGALVIDRHIEVGPDAVTLAPEAAEELHAVVDGFSAAVHQRRGLASPASSG